MKSIQVQSLPLSQTYAGQFDLTQSGHLTNPETFRLFGVRIHNSTLEQAVAHAVACSKIKKQSNLAFVNADCLNKAWNSDAYCQVLNRFSRVYADGSGIKLACAIRSWPLPDNVNGTDMFPRLCLALATQGSSVFLLGGRPGVADACAKAMQARYSNLKVAGVMHGYFLPGDDAEVIRRINASGADVLLVAFGAPNQEFWIAEHSHELTPSVRIGVGGLFDFYSGRIARAPLWMRRIGQEWVWRLMQEPVRMWRRYLIGNPLFLLRVLLVKYTLNFAAYVYQRGAL